jgi:hypothetical protein
LTGVAADAIVVNGHRRFRSRQGRYGA